MYNHAPANYQCPFCLVAAGVESATLYTRQTDIVVRTESVLAFIASHWWVRNKGHVLIIPTKHYENIYDLPDPIAAEIAAAARRIAIAMKQSYQCDGISTRQHNEPAGYQEVWHYHLHVFPRYVDDRLYPADGDKYLTNVDERQPYAAKLRDALKDTSKAPLGDFGDSRNK